MSRVNEQVERFAAAVNELRRHHLAFASGDAGLADADCTAALELVTRAEGVLASIKAGLLRAYQASGRLGANGDKDLAGYAGRTLNRGRAGGRKDAVLARGLAELRSTEQDLVNGEITAGHAQILADTLGRASDARRVALIDEGGEAQLLAAARRQDVAEFAKTVRRWEHGSDRAQADAAADVAYRARSLRTFTQRDGCVKVDALLDPIGGQALLVALDAVTPTKLAIDDARTGEQRRADALVDLALLANRGGSVKPGALAPTQVVVHMSAETLARGLAEQLVHHGGCWGKKAGVEGTACIGSPRNGPTDHAAGVVARGQGELELGEVERGELGRGEAELGAMGRGGAGCRQSGGAYVVHGASEVGRAERGPARGSPRYEPATLEGGFPLSLAAAMMLVCDSAMMRLVVDADGVPLDVGRSQRVWAKEQRLAVFARDQGCRYPGCGRPTRWCEVHHIHTWADGGVTSIDNGITLCRAHHTLVHNEGVRITSIAGGYRFTTRSGLLVGETCHATASLVDVDGRSARVLPPVGSATQAAAPREKREVVAASSA